MEEEIETKLAKIVSNKSEDLDWAKSTYNEKLTEIGGREAEGEMLDGLKAHAVRLVKSEVNKGEAISGDVEKVNVVAIGHGGIRNWSSDNGGTREVLPTFGVVKPQDQPMGLGVFLNDEEEGVDIYNIKEKFRTLNEIEAYYTVGQADDLANTYILNSTEETRVDVKDESEAAPEDKRRSLLQEHTQEAKLDSVRNYMSATNAEGYSAAFGADVKRMNATIVDAVSLDNTSIYTILDDTVIDPAELDDDVRDDRAQTPGMTAWCPKDMMKYDVNSQVELYGSISTMDEGKIVMNIYGIVPLITFELDEDGDSGGNVDVSSI
jgi:hypothetical protein